MAYTLIFLLKNLQKLLTFFQQKWLNKMLNLEQLLEQLPFWPLTSSLS